MPIIKDEDKLWTSVTNIKRLSALADTSAPPALLLEHDKSLASMDDSSKLAHTVPPKELEKIPDNTSKVILSTPDPAVQQPGHIPIHPGAINSVSHMITSLTADSGLTFWCLIVSKGDPSETIHQGYWKGEHQ